MGDQSVVNQLSVPVPFVQTFEPSRMTQPTRFGLQDFLPFPSAASVHAEGERNWFIRLGHRKLSQVTRKLVRVGDTQGC